MKIVFGDDSLASPNYMSSEIMKSENIEIDETTKDFVGNLFLKTEKLT